ncbi:MAG: glycosyltransferase family 4 protein [Phenylobacterium sp.]|uniref:glycosyltransferase family 4 protein n=1 Tax=Phenylobacterium sp. TaxID=1871053 RepID=UPI00272EE91F|nr:glycosyltransferase family 4 protein [Phenylobacterium sp.]MDP2009233.1 glycosyltransferase family 4 protein [Phenylobacterium sp.]
MASRLAIYHPSGQFNLVNNPFGKDVANLELFRALAAHGGFDQVSFLSQANISGADLRKGLLGDAPGGATLTTGSLLAQGAVAQSGTLLRGTPALSDISWLRRRAVGDRAYSLMGLVHTLAPPALRADMAMAVTSPIQPWDALICTSPSVQDALNRMFDDWSGFLADRFGGAKNPKPYLPLIPLGVDQPAIQARADRPEVRAKLREELAIGEADVLVLWLGRLSFFEKAAPQPMFRAIEEAAQASGVKVHFAMLGWFPNGDQDRLRYQAAADAYAPSVAVHFLDGNDQGRVGSFWAASDIFISLVDNIQETFGITPVEAMAAGLPVVVSDWDGYRYTVQDGQQGFLIPTLGGPPGGASVGAAERHALGMESYQLYVGALAQHTAVHVGRAAEAIAALIASPDLRRRMGEAGRKRVREMFDWPVVARQYAGLADELTAIREASPPDATQGRLNPVKGDPNRDFAGFPNQVQDLETLLHVRPGVTTADVDRAMGLDLDRFASSWRCTGPECWQVLDILGAQTRSVKEVLLAFPVERRRPVQMGLMWMCKLGMLDWLEGA